MTAEQRFCKSCGRSARLPAFFARNHRLVEVYLDCWVGLRFIVVNKTHPVKGSCTHAIKLLFTCVQAYSYEPPVKVMKTLKDDEEVNTKLCVWCTEACNGTFFRLSLLVLAGEHCTTTQVRYSYFLYSSMIRNFQ